MSSSAEVAHTVDILLVIFSYLTPRKHLVPLLRTSPLFFRLVAPKLYNPLPISNACNPLAGVSLSGEDQGPYSKARLLNSAPAVVVERAKGPNGRSVWTNFDRHPSLPSVEIVIMQSLLWEEQTSGIDKAEPTRLSNSIIEHLCSAATRLELLTPAYTLVGASVSRERMPSLPNVETLVVKGTAAKLQGMVHVVGDYGDHDKLPCPNIKTVHLFLWGDVMQYPLRDQSRTSFWDMDKGKITLQIREMEHRLYKRSYLLGHLPDMLKALGSRVSSVDGLDFWLYNVDPIFQRSGYLKGTRLVNRFKYMLERDFEWKMLSSTYPDPPDEDRKIRVFFRTGVDFYKYKAFNSIPISAEEEWYYSAVLDPSARLVSLRASLEAETGLHGRAFMGLGEHEAEWLLRAYTRPTFAELYLQRR
ncbi:hypothetical protein L198_00019 [Cryptococcus wingfieldii CBS 7118]|uniref:Uncharacterized protein n=1 Tax=Cryptococcus wingfieldii CBS 7118 TaxID=1295528 RepID=A0A1E3K5T3_9TREE|nr:hypothetical protein L198_00019 [Cryptococcus wingfieldii CBS 7118]ODO08296.1 hypothetical protein L198_00019 [Cryptococcus wingfieldii CBS 7118]